MDAMSASISACESILPGSAGAEAAAGARAAAGEAAAKAGAGDAAAGLTLAALNAAPPPACGDFPIILASKACCSGLNPLASMCLYPFR